MYVICYNGIYETVHSEYALETRIGELMDELGSHDGIITFDADTQLR